MIYNCRTCSKLITIKISKGYNLRPLVCSPRCFIKFLQSNYSPKPFVNTKDVSIISNMDVDMSMKSFYERLTADCLTKLNISWEYEKYILSLTVRKTFRYLYLPDFYLPDFGVFLEVKGRWEGSAYRKVKLASEFYPVFVLFREDIQMLQGGLK